MSQRTNHVCVRFAPSPTGQLHVGNVRTALFNWLFARQQQGRFILRIEDTDLERSQPEYEQQIYEDLKWLGLSWDEGPEVGGDFGPYRQSQRLEIYNQYVNRLLQMERAYYCFCTPEALDAERLRAKAAGVAYTYSGRCRGLSPSEVQDRKGRGAAFTIRFRMRPGPVTWEDRVRGQVDWQAELLGDFVIIKSDGWPVYNFAVVVDDISMEVTHVIRGDGHLSNTPRQILIYEALGARVPEFCHLSTILGPDGSKLSKRHGATSMAEFRDQGYLPEALFNFLGLLGWSPEGETEVLSKDEMIERFSLERVGKAPAIFDVDKLNWMNRIYLKQADPSRLLSLATKYLQHAGRLKDTPLDEPTTQWLGLVLNIVVTYLDTLSQVVSETAVLLDYDLDVAVQDEEVFKTLRDPEAIDVIRALEDQLAPLQQVTLESFRAATTAVKQRTGRKGRALFHPIRIALTARPSGPELVKLIPIYELGSQLDVPRPVLSVRERLRLFLNRATGGGK